MKSVLTVRSGDWPDARIYPLSDLHLGAPECNLSEIKSVLAKIARDDRALVILNGDIMDTATRSSLGDVYAAKAAPLKQLEMAAEMLEPIAGKIIGATCGNHEARIYKADGIDTMRLLCRELRCEDCYAPEGVLLFVRFGLGSPHGCGRKQSPRNYTIYATHGSGGGRKEGSKINRVADLAGIVDADIYIHSHTHLPAYFIEDYFRADIQNAKAQQVTRGYLNTAAALGYGGYGQMQAYKPATVAFPYIELSGTSQSFKAVL